MKRAVYTLALVLPLLTLQAWAGNDVLDVRLSIRPQLSRFLQDGEIVGTGQAKYYGEHRGFQVWLDAEQPDNAPASYLIRGKTNPRNTLRVKLGPSNWQPDEKQKRGVIRLTPENFTDFSLVAEGNQHPAVDKYDIVVRVAVLEP